MLEIEVSQAKFKKGGHTREYFQSVEIWKTW